MPLTIPPNCFSGETLGCTYPSASNYDSNATFDDGSCIPFVYEFRLNMYATHLQACPSTSNPTVDQVGFMLHVPLITHNGTFSVVKTFLSLYAYQYAKFDDVRVACNNSNPKYVYQPIANNPATNRIVNNRPHIIILDTILANYSASLALNTSDSTYTNGSIPITITIWADGLIFTKNIVLNIYDYNDTFTPANEIIIVT